jgi:phosphoglycolate phosphatase
VTTLPRPSASRLVLFDFDGTIADTLDTLIEVYNTVLAPAYQCLPFDGRGREHWRGATAAELIRRFRVPKLKLPLMVLRARREMARRLASVKPHPGVCDALRALRRPDTALGILTSNSHDNVRRFLGANGVGDIFDEIHTGRNLFGKAPQIRRLVRRSKLGPARTVYVGDEVRDIEAGRAAGVRTIAVAWGFSNPESLERAGPNLLVREPSELPQAVERLLAASPARP